MIGPQQRWRAWDQIISQFFRVAFNLIGVIAFQLNMLNVLKVQQLTV